MAASQEACKWASFSVAVLLFSTALAAGDSRCSNGLCSSSGHSMLQVARQTDLLLSRKEMDIDSASHVLQTSLQANASQVGASLQAPVSQKPEDETDEAESAPSLLFNLGLFAAFSGVILLLMILLLLLVQLLHHFIERWQDQHLASFDVPAVQTNLSTARLAAHDDLTKQSNNKGRSVQEVAAELNGLQLYQRMNGDQVRLGMLLNLANSSKPQEEVRQLVEKASKMYKVKLSQAGLDQATNGLLALAISVKAAQAGIDPSLKGKARFQHVVTQLLRMIRTCRALGVSLTHHQEEKIDTHCENHAEHLADRYNEGERKPAHKSFQDVRHGKSGLAAYFASQKWLDHITIAFVFLYSQVCAVVYAVYLKNRFPKMYEFMGPWMLVSRGEAIAIIVLTVLMIFLLSRSIMTELRPFMAWSSVLQTISDKHVLIHKYIGMMLVFCAGLHILGHLRGSIPAIIGETDSSKVQAAFTYGTKLKFNFNSWGGALQSWPAVTGILCVLVLVAFWSLSNERVRRYWFELFHYPHFILVALWCSCLIAHGWKQWLGIGVPIASVSVLPMVLIYGFSRLWDINKGSHRSIVIHNATVKQSTVLLEINTGISGFSYETGMYCMLKVPEISNFQWHPFTIASAGGQTKFQVLFAVVGDWTTKLKDLLLDAQKNETPYPQICVRGGYGAPAEGMKDQKHIIMVGGGVGATPFLSFMSNISHSAQTGNFDQFEGVKSAVFYWLSRDPNDFVWVNNYNTIIKDTPQLRDKISVRLCLTKALDTKQDGAAELTLLWMGVEIALSKFDATELAVELGIPTQFGRPKWEQEFTSCYQELKGTHGQRLDIGVFACGAKMLTDSLEEACSAASDSNVSFILYAEEF